MCKSNYRIPLLTLYIITKQDTVAVLGPSFQRLSQCFRSLSYIDPVIFNSIPLAIRNCESLRSFKAIYKEFLIENYT